MSTVAAPDERSAIVEVLQSALRAVESGDESRARAAIDDLVQWRTQPLVQGLVRLARELSVALGDEGRSHGASA